MTNAENQSTILVTGRRGTIELTPQMVTAGARILVYPTVDDVDVRELATEVFEAMWRERP